MRLFQTLRLDLRPIAECDEALYCGLYTDPEVMRHIATPLSTEAAQRAFAAALKRTRVDDPTLRLWVLLERAPGLDVGILALVRHGDEAGALELGTMFVTAGQGRGLAAESLSGLLGRLFVEMPGLREVWTRHSPKNLPVRRLMRRVGFSPGKASGPEVRWQMTRERWLAL